MKILHHGAVDGVTGSCHELQLENSSGILIDCGLFQGAETSSLGAGESTLEIDFPIAHIQALVVTHVHIDHVGRIPYLLAAGFTGPIYCSEPSAVLLPLVLEDAVKIGFTRSRSLIKHFLHALAKQLVPLPYAEWHEVTPELKIKLKPAGHILGSAYVECLVMESASPRKVTFSGDLGAPYSPLLSAPRSPYGTDVLVIESTYGDRKHVSRQQRKKALQGVIEKAVQDKGVVLIPAFSIGRTQELLYELEGIIHQNARQPLAAHAWEDVEIVIDSPLAAKFTETYKALAPYWDKEACSRLRQGRHPLSFEQLTTIDDHEIHTQTVAYLKKTARPTIVIAASGMCAGGRIMNYLRALIEDRRTDILFVGYQAKGTPGRDIQQYAGREGGYVMLDGDKYAINAQVHTISGYSAHADQDDLLRFVKGMRKRPSEIRIVHGDVRAKVALKEKFEYLLGRATEVIIP